MTPSQPLAGDVPHFLLLALAAAFLTAECLRREMLRNVARADEAQAPSPYPPKKIHHPGGSNGRNEETPT